MFTIVKHDDKIRPLAQANSVDPDQTAPIVSFQQTTKADNFCLDWRFNESGCVLNNSMLN